MQRVDHEEDGRGACDSTVAGRRCEGCCRDRSWPRAQAGGRRGGIGQRLICVWRVGWISRRRILNLGWGWPRDERPERMAGRIDLMGDGDAPSAERATILWRSISAWTPHATFEEGQAEVCRRVRQCRFRGRHPPDYSEKRFLRRGLGRISRLLWQKGDLRGIVMSQKSVVCHQNTSFQCGRREPSGEEECYVHT